MKLTEKDYQTLQAVKKLKNFVDLLNRRKVDIFADGNVTKENLDEANGRVKELKALIFMIEAADALKPPADNEWD